MKWYLASYPPYCYLTLSRTKFQQFFLCALCCRYFKNPSGKRKIISGRKRVIYLNEDSAGAEQSIQWGQLMSRFVLYGGAGVAGQAHASVPLSKLPGRLPQPCPLHTDTPPAPCLPHHFCYSAPSSQGFHRSIKQSAWHSAHSTPRIRGLVYSLKQKKVAWD